MSILGEATPEEMIDVASRMAQELQDFCDEAEAAGSPLPGVLELINYWEMIYSKTALSWKNPLVTSADEPKGLACL